MQQHPDNQLAQDSLDLIYTTTPTSPASYDVLLHQYMYAQVLSQQMSPENQPQYGLGLDNFESFLAPSSPLLINTQQHSKSEGLDSYNNQMAALNSAELAMMQAEFASPELIATSNMLALMNQMSPARRDSVISLVSVPGSMNASEFEYMQSPAMVYSPQVGVHSATSAISTADFFFHGPASPVLPGYCITTTSCAPIRMLLLSMMMMLRKQSRLRRMQDRLLMSPAADSPMSPKSPKFKRARSSESATELEAPVAYNCDESDMEESPVARRSSVTHIETTPVSSAGTPKRGRNSGGSRSSGKSFPCLYPGCNKVFPRQYNLKSHQFCHSGLRPHTCELCEASFARKHDLQRHTRTLHATNRPFKCNTCSLSFTQSEQLKRHHVQEKQCVRGGLLACSCQCRWSQEKECC
ncbi:hypothetical protein BDR26DRAFT_823297 [Obelidium mucronatum]|nr:hypothetical protein BDR26DRAFT_823297 [Obelidium mucronatum]